MTFCLDTTIIKPEKDVKIENAVILLHGYGGDGKDISMLSLNWKRHLTNTIFLCPNGHEPCSINPSGYQWFDLTKDDPKYILNETIKAEKKLNEFIDQVKIRYNLENDNLSAARTLKNIYSLKDININNIFVKTLYFFLLIFIFKYPY